MNRGFSFEKLSFSIWTHQWKYREKFLLRKYIYHLRVDECYKMLKLFRDRKFVKIEKQKEVSLHGCILYENALLLL